MTQSVLRVSAIALGAAAFALSSFPLAFADPSDAPVTSDASTPSLSEPAPTPGWAEAPPTGTAADERLPARHYAHRSARHYAWRDGHRTVVYDHNPVATAATGVVGAVADLGSLAAYPIYCFPNYGSCPVQWAHRF